MIKINLLPYRERIRRERQALFYQMLLFCALGAFFVVVLVGLIIGHAISRQDVRNAFIAAENIKLDKKIKEVADLTQEIAALKARQQAVENLQEDRNQPVHIMSELVVQTPEGVYLRSIKQDGRRLVLSGYAQSNERVSEFLRNLGNHSQRFIRPELIEIRASSIGQGKDSKRAYDFTINVNVVGGSTDSGAAANQSVPLKKP